VAGVPVILGCALTAYLIPHLTGNEGGGASWRSPLRDYDPVRGAVERARPALPVLNKALRDDREPIVGAAAAKASAAIKEGTNVELW
jgi:hypothetical protein